MAETMFECVGGRLLECLEENADLELGAPLDRAQLALALAHAAIKAMREPTQAMIDAWGGIPDEPFCATDDDVCRYGWQQMIDAALSLSPSPGAS